MTLSDLGEDLPIRDRAIHSSQLLYALWVFSKKNMLEVEYRTKKGEPIVISSVSSEICETIYADEDIATMARHVNFNILNPDLLKGHNPFEGLSSKISDELYAGRYHSQTHEEIDIETYIYKLTLSIFSDYLVLLAEGALDETIKVQYYNDGCILTGKKNNENILTRVPAPLESSELKELLSTCVINIIESYKNSTLASKYILEAKENNMYLQKRLFIKTKTDRPDAYTI
jgi:hypothetical protein